MEKLRMMWMLPLILFLQSHGDTYLISMQDLPRQLWETVPVIEVIDNVCILHATQQDMERIQQYKLSHNVLCRNPLQYNNEYFIVFPTRDVTPTIEQHCRILAVYDNFLIVSVTTAQKNRFLGLRMEKLHMDFTPFYIPCETVHGLHQDRGKFSQESVKQVVDRVSKDSLRSYVRKLQNFRTREASETGTEVTPWLEAKFKELGADSVFTQYIASSGPNVIAVIKGQNHDPKQYCLMGAHLDGAYGGPPAAGADDNASGTAALLEAVRVLSTAHFENTIRLAAFNAEEIGYYGSQIAAQEARSNGEKIIGGMINLDMIGYKRTTPAIYLHYDRNISAGNEEFVKLFKETAGKYVTLNCILTPSSDIMSASDHYSFWSNGFIAFMAIEASNRDELCPNYHGAGDMLDNSGGLNNAEMMTNAARAAIANLATLAVPVTTGVAARYPQSILRKNLRFTFDNLHGSVHIDFSVSTPSPLRISAYDVKGKQIASITQAVFTPGAHSITWKPAAMAAQMVIIRATAGTQQLQTTKVVIPQ
ncbi:MAG: M28 family peptidase [Chitinivibrionales bacterium]|nr:M28 family peptidase [Chitinivibrionales bacterium]